MALLLLLLLMEPQANAYQCSIAPLPRCTNNSVLGVTKSTEMYQVTLLATEWQCYNEFCLLNDQNYRQKTLMCNDICGACQRLEPLGGNGKAHAESYDYNTHTHISIHADCGTSVTICEAQLDIYLDEFCAQATSTRNRTTTCTSATITAEIQCPTSTITVHGNLNNNCTHYSIFSLLYPS